MRYLGENKKVRQWLEVVQGIKDKRTSKQIEKEKKEKKSGFDETECQERSLLPILLQNEIHKMQIVVLHKITTVIMTCRIQCNHYNLNKKTLMQNIKFAGPRSVVN